MFKYIALGDSFSSGEGVEEFFEPLNGCHRSKRAYATLVDLPGTPHAPIYQLSLAGRAGIEWGFQACSGATAKDLTTLRSGWGDAFAQLDTRATIDVGNGNLLAFFDFPGLDLGPYAEVLGGLGLGFDGDLAERIEDVRGDLVRVRQDAALLLHEHRASPGDVLAYLRRWMLVDGARVARSPSPITEFADIRSPFPPAFTKP